MCIIIPTCDNYNKNHYFIQRTKKYTARYNIDTIFYDSSKKDDLKGYINNLKISNIIYDRYDEKIKDDHYMDYKIYSVAKKYMDQYDYIWFCRDGSIPLLENIYFELEKDFKEKKEFVVISPNSVDPNDFEKKVYTKAEQLAKDLLGEMTILGSVIYSSSLIKKLMVQYPINKITNYGFWNVIPLFHYIAKNKFEANYYKRNIIEYIPSYTSYFISDEDLTSLYGQRWEEVINQLPSEYENVKDDIYKFENWMKPPLADSELLYMRMNGKLKFKNVWRQRSVFIKNKGVSFSKIITTSLMPSWYAKYYAQKPYSRINRCIKAIYSTFVELPLKILRYIKNDIKALRKGTKYKKWSNINYERDIDCFAINKDVKSNLLVGDRNKNINPLISFIIPTYKRVELLKDALGSVLDQRYVSFEWDIIVIDNEPCEGNKKNETQKYIEMLNSDKIKYYRNEKNLGVDGNINRGVELAKGKWVSMLHDDDLIVSDYLVRIKRRIDYYENLGKKPLGYIAPANEVFYGKAFTIDKKAQSHFMQHNLYYCDQEDNIKMAKRSRNTMPFWGYVGISTPTCGTLILKKAYMETGGMNEKLSIITDAITANKVMKNYSLYMNESILGFYRWGANYSITAMPRIVKDLFDYREYTYKENIFTRVMGFLFRFEHYENEIKGFVNISQKTNNYDLNSFSNVCEYNPIKTRNIIFRLGRKLYHKYIEIETKTNAKKAKKFLKETNYESK